MYQTHWGLRESRFRGPLDPKYLCQSPTHQEALARAALSGGATASPGAAGRTFRQRQVALAEGLCRATTLHRAAGRATGLWVLLRPEMLGLLAAEWGLRPRAVGLGGPVMASGHRSADRYRYQQLEAVGLLDDADQADPQVLQHVSRLARFDSSPAARLTLVLTGHREGMSNLGQSLLDLVELRIDVEPWEQSETQQYVNTLLGQAGRTSPAFAEPAVARLHELSRGIPRAWPNWRTLHSWPARATMSGRSTLESSRRFTMNWRRKSTR